MNWQHVVPLVIVVVAAVALVWRSAGKKSSCGCKCGCAHDHSDVKKTDGVR